MNPSAGTRPARFILVLHPHSPALIYKGLLRCLAEDAPSVRRADAGKAAELRATRALGSRRANYGTSAFHDSNEMNNKGRRVLHPS